MSLTNGRWILSPLGTKYGVALPSMTWVGLIIVVFKSFPGLSNLSFRSASSLDIKIKKSIANNKKMFWGFYQRTLGC